MSMVTYLEHHGIQGQLWGVRRFQNYDGSLTQAGKERYGKTLKEYKKKKKIPKNATAQNLENWGNSPKTNVLYISGTSGSGKSTVATNLKDKNTEIIHLDSYFDNPDGPKSKDFNEFLKRNKSDYKKLSLPKDKISINDWGKVAERFEKEIEAYGNDTYKRNKKVIVEGVQLLDDTIRPDKTYFNDKPFIMLNTNMITSLRRANKRDNEKFRMYNITDRIAWQKDIKNVKKNNSLKHSYEVHLRKD